MIAPSFIIISAGGADAPPKAFAPGNSTGVPSKILTLC